MPSLFWLGAGDGAIAAVGWVGVALSLLVLAGYANALILAVAVRAAHLGRRHRPGLLRVRLGDPARRDRLPLHLPLPAARRPAVSRAGPPPAPVVWLLRWLIVRVMWGAGLIKLRGDPCWRDLTCLDFHFETQPIPNPLTPAFHFLPSWAHKLGVLFNHVVELAAPFFVFGAAAPPALDRGRADGGAADRPDRQRQPVVPELADAGADPRLLRRRRCGAACCRARSSRGPSGARAAAIPSRAQGATTAVAGARGRAAQHRPGR